MSKQSIFLVLTSAIVIAGGICRAGSLVEVTEAEAKNLLHRGKARLATADDGAPVAEQEEAEQDDVDLSKLNKAQLIDLAQYLGLISVNDSDTKAKIIEAIEAAKEAQAAE